MGFWQDLQGFEDESCSDYCEAEESHSDLESFDFEQHFQVQLQQGQLSLHDVAGLAISRLCPKNDQLSTHDDFEFLRTKLMHPPSDLYPQIDWIKFEFACGDLCQEELER